MRPPVRSRRTSSSDDVERLGAAAALGWLGIVVSPTYDQTAEGNAIRYDVGTDAYVLLDKSDGPVSAVMRTQDSLRARYGRTARVEPGQSMDELFRSADTQYGLIELLRAPVILGASVNGQARFGGRLGALVRSRNNYFIFSGQLRYPLDTVYGPIAGPWSIYLGVATDL